MKTYKINHYGKTYEVTIKKTEYSNNGSLAILLETTDYEPFGVITVNLPNSCASEEYQYVDTNNCPWAEKFIKDNGLGNPTGIMGYSGFCQYPLYRFNLEALN